MANRRMTHDVAIVAMGCTPFRDHWLSSADDLLVEAVTDASAEPPLFFEDEVGARHPEEA